MQIGKKSFNILRSKRFWLGFILTAVLVFGVHTIFSFSEMKAPESNGLSKRVTAQIQVWTDEHFDIDPTDSFWKYDLNNIVRKMGHVAEYSMLGFVLCSLLNVITKRNWLAIIISPLLGFGIACIDEYLQNFSEGRGPGWKDVRLDTISVILGVLLAGIVFGLYWYIHKLKNRLKVHNHLS